MIKVACNRPRENAEAITNIGFPSLGLSPRSTLEPFGISIGTEMAVIPGRELAPPGLNYKVGNARVNNGSWNILDVKFHRGALIPSWCVLVVRDGRNMLQGPDDPQLLGLVDGFATKLRKSGMGVPPGKPVIKPIRLFPLNTDDGVRSRSVQLIRDVLSSAGKPGFVLVLLEARDNYIYPAIKVSFFFFTLWVCTDFLVRKSVIWSWVYIRFVCNLVKHWGIRRNRINISRTWR